MPKPLHLLRALLFGAALAVPAISAAAEEANFDFSVSGIKVGTLQMVANQTGSDYSAQSKINTSGLVNMFADFFFDGEATGSLRKDGTVVPIRFAAVSKSPRALRETEIDWKDGTPVVVSVEPPRESAPQPDEQAGTLDPVSAGFRLLRTAPAETICNTTVDVFDGSRRSRLELGPPVADGDRLVCEGAYSRIKGEAHSLTKRREFPFQVVFSQNGAGLARLERIEAPTNFGTAVVSRAD
jgi:hypothetical protein